MKMAEVILQLVYLKKKKLEKKNLQFKNLTQVPFKSLHPMINIPSTRENNIYL